MMVEIPVYVTRKDAHGMTGSVSLAAWMPLLAVLLIWVNVVAWSLVGIIEALRVLT